MDTNQAIETGVQAGRDAARGLTVDTDTLTAGMDAETLDAFWTAYQHASMFA